LFYFQILC